MTYQIIGTTIMVSNSTREINAVHKYPKNII